MIDVSSKRFPLFALTLFLIFIVWLGSRGIANKSLWYDEVWSLRYAGGAEFGPISLAETVDRVAGQLQHERNPPGYYVLLNAWGTFTGWSEYSGRVLSLLAGLLAVAWTYRLGCDLAVEESRQTRLIVGIGAAVTLSASAFFINYAQEIRAYIFVVLLVAMNLALYWRILQAKRRLSLPLQITFVAGWAMMLFAHYSTLLIVAVLGLYHLMFAPRGPRWWRIITLVLIGTLPFLALSQNLLKGSETAVETLRVGAMSFSDIVRVLALSFSSESAALFALLLVFALNIRRKYARLVWFLTVACFLLAAVGNVFVPIISSIRYVILLWPLLALLMGMGLAYLARRRISPLPILAIWIIAGSVASFNLSATDIPHNTRTPWIAMDNVLQQHIQPGDLVVFHSPEFVWYAAPELEHYMARFSNRFSLMESIPGFLKDGDYYNHVRDFVQNTPRIWIGVDQTLPPNFRLGEFQRAIADNYLHCYTAFDLPEMRFDLYTHTVSAPAVRYENGVGLTPQEPLPAVVKDSLAVPLNISHPDTLPRDTYSVALHVDDASGNLRAQIDFGVPADNQSCQMAVIPLSNLPPGAYKLLAVVYNWQNPGERIPGTFGGAAPAERVLLGTFAKGE